MRYRQSLNIIANAKTLLPTPKPYCQRQSIIAYAKTSQPTPKNYQQK
jgi:hypothetical protein